MWWRAEKANSLVLNGAFLYLYKLFQEVIKDPEKVKEEWFLIGRRGGRAAIDGMFNLVQMMTSKSVEDLTYIIDTAWYVFLGEQISSIKYIPPDDQGIEKIIWTWDNCVMCANIQNEMDPDTLKDVNIEAVAAGVFQVTLEMIQDYVGNSFQVEVKNTKSGAWGDPHCEMTAIFTPINKENSLFTRS